MKRVLLAFAMLLVLSSATFVRADPTSQGLREPSFPGGNASEGDLMTINAPGLAEMMGKAAIGSLLMMSIYL